MFCPVTITKCNIVWRHLWVTRITIACCAFVRVLGSRWSRNRVSSRRQLETTMRKVCYLPVSVGMQNQCNLVGALWNVYLLFSSDEALCVCVCCSGHCMQLFAKKKPVNFCFFLVCCFLLHKNQRNRSRECLSAIMINCRNCQVPSGINSGNCFKPLWVWRTSGTMGVPRFALLGMFLHPRHPRNCKTWRLNDPCPSFIGELHLHQRQTWLSVFKIA